MPPISATGTLHDPQSLLASAILAPSSHNTQPWIFRLRDGCIELLADRTRALPANDPDDRELTISCGCALLNLRVAAAHAGIATNVRLLAEPEDEDLLARAELDPTEEAGTQEAALFPYMENRRTFRKRFEDRPVPDEALRALEQAAAQEGARFQVLADEATRQATARLVAEGDAAQWSNPSWRRELAAWMHPRRRGDGLTVPGLMAPVAQLVVRTFDMGHGVGAKDSQLAEGSPLLALIATQGDTVEDWMRAGQALERALLVACEHGLQASYLNQPVQVASLRPKLQELAGGSGFPQLLIRLGYPSETLERTPRRPLEDVME
ncbi:nitroreductase [Thiohalorhabdus denitrificans]|uniref:Nitroreductase n=1 Tax=Thiohalorhabdus denitrificans TaxID=381306 RepID=A0A0P9C9S7_9GAMM|nr:nitroreductase family protein [Thiohalorhabdus denitrificans]KPV41939.1 nitroreductase [Thiohalorhabdus denitrificans]SCY66128.1 Nitroreductase [Thiohalorhabdus denitrificans]